MSHKPNMHAISQSFDEYMKKLGNDSTVKNIMDEGTLSDLSLFAQSNIAATGYMLGRLFKDDGNMSFVGNKRCFSGDPEEWWVTVSFVIRDEEHVESVTEDDVFRTRTTNKSYSSNDSDPGSASTKTVNVATVRKRYGKKFGLNVVWTFETDASKNVDPITFRKSEDIVIEPTFFERLPKIRVPEPQQFFIGSVLHILHRAESVNTETLPGFWNAMADEKKAFPRRNPEVERIVKGLQEFCKMTDFISHALARYIDTADITKRLNFPWDIHRKSAPNDELTEMGDLNMTDELYHSGPRADPKTLLSAQETAMFGQFHETLKREFCTGGEVTVLLQLIYAGKFYAKHFLACFDAIEETITRSFAGAIGKKNADVLVNGGAGSLDNLLFNVGNHKSAARLQPCSAIGKGYHVSFNIKFPGQKTSTTLNAQCHTYDSHNFEMCFGNGGWDDGIPAIGEYKRFVFQAPTAATCAALPSISVGGGSDYDAKPMAVALGSPNGNKTQIGAAWIFSGGRCFEVALDVAAIPSNAAFDDALARLPKEMQNFARDIREMDLTTDTAVTLHLIELRPIFAKIIGLTEAQFMECKNRRRQLTKLVDLVKAGCSLDSISQHVNDDFVDVSEGAGLIAPDIEQVQQEIQELCDDVYAFGKAMREDEKDEYGDNRPSLSGPRPAFTALGGCSDEGSVRFRSCGTDGCDTLDYYDASSSPTLEGEQEAEQTDAQETNEPKKDTNSQNVLKTLLGSLNDISNPKAFSAAKISVPDPSTDVKFATRKFPCVQGGYVQSPPPKAYSKNVGLMSETSALANLLRNYGKPVHVKTLELYGIFTHPEKDLLKAMMSGSPNPTKIHQEVSDKISKMLR